MNGTKIKTGVEGFDELLKGGLIPGGVYLLMGPPGSGKTIIANQICFEQARSGKRALYVTLLAETHGRMMNNLRDLTFFNEEVVTESLNYIGGYQVLEKEGLDGLLKMLRESVRKFKASLIIIDGVASAEDVANSPLQFKKFVHQLNSVLSTSGATTILLSSMDGNMSNPEHTMVDGIVKLSMTRHNMRMVREIEVRKFRGSDHFHGSHFFEITGEGVRIYPRIESLYERPSRPISQSKGRDTFDIPKLDKLLNGGLYKGSMTSLLGPAGSGKTLLGSLSSGRRRARRAGALLRPLRVAGPTHPKNGRRGAQVLGLREKGATRNRLALEARAYGRRGLQPAAP